MKNLPPNKWPIGLAIALIFAMFVYLSTAEDTKRSAPSESEAAVRTRLDEIQTAAQSLNADKVFSFVLENDQGALVQNGRLFLTRAEALDSTKQAFNGLQKVEYRFTRQNVTLLSPTTALAIGEGTSSAMTADGRSFSTPFVQSVVLVLTNGEWKVFHAHRSFPPK